MKKYTVTLFVVKDYMVCTYDVYAENTTDAKEKAKIELNNSKANYEYVDSVQINKKS